MDGVRKQPSLFPLLVDLSFVFVKINLAMEAVHWERHWRSARGHDLGFMRSLGQGAICIRDKLWEQTRTKPPLSLSRSTILEFKCILTKQVAAAV